MDEDGNCNNELNNEINSLFNEERNLINLVQHINETSQQLSGISQQLINNVLELNNSMNELPTLLINPNNNTFNNSEPPFREFDNSSNSSSDGSVDTLVPSPFSETNETLYYNGNDNPVDFPDSPTLNDFIGSPNYNGNDNPVDFHDSPTLNNFSGSSNYFGIDNPVDFPNSPTLNDFIRSPNYNDINSPVGSYGLPTLDNTSIDNFIHSPREHLESFSSYNRDFDNLGNTPVNNTSVFNNRRFNNPGNPPNIYIFNFPLNVQPNDMEVDERRRNLLDEHRRVLMNILNSFLHSRNRYYNE